ncbi:DEAD/DEAH box helicase [Herbaspirillum huttiense]|uniref:ATP-dependent RNA helicase RhlE n=1 Tax=Herbaspirillum huttiense subsp. lycopersici TaxID=3074428 RepID=A0ABU2ETJ7_9BURK|nr:DEAD/DEAH box helicase [Herbaspirillum huttiense]MDR9851062.1 DEAD/DEAH box helicase [Herbaspirillum huttiense SE1]
MSFSALGLSDEIVRAVSEQGYTSPTPIQAQAVPAVLSGGDLLAGAQTGTGKTAGFTLPLLQRLSAMPRQKINGHLPIRALILAPTRELAAQVEESVRQYGKYLPLTSACIFGGVGINPQITLLKRGVDILVATPGRLLDHMQQGTVNLQHIQILVLDEADRMLDMGFIRDIRKVLAALPPKRQNLLFSATFADEIKKLADSLLNNPALIEVARRNSTVEVIAQKIHPVDRDKKHPMLAHLIKTHQWKQVLVFTRTKHGANKLVEQLARDGITAMAIHGNKSQSARTKALAEFKDGKLTALIATDIAARGIDIDQLPHVVNYDLPNVPEDYVHRIGRTGRAGATGEAVSLVCVDERDLLHDIERFIKREIPVEVIAGFEPDPTAKPQPIQLRSGQGRHQNGGGRGGQRSAPRKPAGNGNAAAPKPAGGNAGHGQAAKPRAAANGNGNGNGNGNAARGQGGRGNGGGNGGNAGNGGNNANRAPKPANANGQPRSAGQPQRQGGPRPSALTHGGQRAAGK